MYSPAGFCSLIWFCYCNDHNNEQRSQTNNPNYYAEPHQGDFFRWRSWLVRLLCGMNSWACRTLELVINNSDSFNNLVRLKNNLIVVITLLNKLKPTTLTFQMNTRLSTRPPQIYCLCPAPDHARARCRYLGPTPAATSSRLKLTWRTRYPD